MDRTCKACGKVFDGYSSSRACSDACRRALKSATNRRYNQSEKGKAFAGSRTISEAQRAKKNKTRSAWRKANRDKENAMKIRHYWKNPEAARRARSDAAKRRRRDNPDIVRQMDAVERAKKRDLIRQIGKRYSARIIREMTDCYLAGLIFHDAPRVPRSMIPKSLLSAKREQLRIQRHLRKDRK